MIETHGYQARPVYFFFVIIPLLVGIILLFPRNQDTTMWKPMVRVMGVGTIHPCFLQGACRQGDIDTDDDVWKVCCSALDLALLTFLSPVMPFRGSLSRLENWGSINEQIVQVHSSHTDTVHKKGYTAVDPCYSVENKVSVSISVKTSSLRASQMQGERMILAFH